MSSRFDSKVGAAERAQSQAGGAYPQIAGTHRASKVFLSSILSTKEPCKRALQKSSAKEPCKRALPMSPSVYQLQSQITQLRYLSHIHSTQMPLKRALWISPAKESYILSIVYKRTLLNSGVFEWPQELVLHLRTARWKMSAMRLLANSVHSIWHA